MKIPKNQFENPPFLWYNVRVGNEPGAKEQIKMSAGR